MHCSCSFPTVFFIGLGIFLFIRWMNKIDRASRETAERMYDPTQPDVQRAQRYDVHATVPKPFESSEALLIAAAVKPTCPVCNDIIEGKSAACPWCKAAHHPECFALNDGCGKCEFTTT
jgi:hypothetical protein